jgi:LUD domain
MTKKSKDRGIFMALSASNSDFAQLASAERISKTVQALEANNMRTLVVETGEEARAAVLEIIPSGGEVFHAASRTLEVIGLAEAIATSTRFQPVRPRIMVMDRTTQRREIRVMAASPDVLVGSVQAITEQGQVLLASATGSQLGTAASGAGSVIWVVGTQKLVRTLDDGFRRIHEPAFRTHPCCDFGIIASVQKSWAFARMSFYYDRLPLPPDSLHAR